MSATTAQEAAVYIIFGGTGDLAARKLFPSLAQSCLEGRFPANMRWCMWRRAGYASRTPARPTRCWMVQENGPLSW